MVGGRRKRLDLYRVLTIGDTVPRSVGAILIAIVVTTFAARVAPGLARILSLDGPQIFSGELWRLVTWVFPQVGLLTLVFAGFVLHWLGRDLAHTWSERRFLQVFFGYAVWSAFWTALVAALWSGADRPYVGAWPVLNALLVGWGFSRPGAQINLYGLVPMTGRVFAWLVVGGTVLFAVWTPAEFGDYVPHLSALVLAFLLDAGITPRRLWLRAKQRWYEVRLRRRASHLRPVPRNDRPSWMN